MMRMALFGQGGQFLTYSWTGTTSTRPWPWRAEAAAVCPSCRAGPDPIWHISWHLLPCVICPIHRVYLTGWCPSCHTRISVGDTPRYRRECNGPFGPQGRIVGARNCRQQLDRLPCEPVGSERLQRIQYLGHLRAWDAVGATAANCRCREHGASPVSGSGARSAG
jgi:hypothetical protein